MTQDTKENYDYIIAGMGAAGLSLAMRLKTSNIAFNKILLIDKDLKNKNDRTWCFWTKDADAWYYSIVYRKWSQFEFISQDFRKVFELKPYSYFMIRGIDFYSYCLKELKEDNRFDIRNAEILGLSSEHDLGVLQTKNSSYQAKYIFNSAFRHNLIKKNDINYVQHFKGWVIETTDILFDVNLPVFMDFRTAQYQDCRFYYLIPLAPNRALVEYTGFSPNALPSEEYDKKLHHYLENMLNIKDYNIVEREYGEIPMMESDFVNPYGPQVINIGTAGGSSKASTGYTFYFIQKNTNYIIDKLEKNQQLVDFKRSKKFKLYDSVLLDVINKNSIPADKIFTSLFKNNNITDLLTFLNEESSIWKDLGMMNSVPLLAFIKSTIVKLKHLYD